MAELKTILRCALDELSSLLSDAHALNLEDIMDEGSEYPSTKDTAIELAQALVEVDPGEGRQWLSDYYPGLEAQV